MCCDSLGDKSVMSDERSARYHGVIARYSVHDMRWFAVIGFVPFVVGALGMMFSPVNYFGLSYDIGEVLGLGSFVLTESMIMVAIFFLFGMLFFAGGIEWYVLCRHCPCYEHSGKEHGNEGRFYCLANWGSPKLFKYKPGRISRGGQLVFVTWSLLFYALPILYLVDRLELVAVQIIVIASFFFTLRHWCCSKCPNFGCILNCVPEVERSRFVEAFESGQVYDQ